MSKMPQPNLNVANTIGPTFNEENILSLLETLNIGTFRNIKIIQEVTHSTIYKNTLLEIPNDSCVGENQILLSVKQGQPTVDQIYSAIYQQGSDCQNRIIAFTGGHCWDDKENPGADIDKVKSLVEILQNKMQKREVKGKRHSYYIYDCGQPHDRRNYNWDPFKNMWDWCDKTRMDFYVAKDIIEERLGGIWSVNARFLLKKTLREKNLENTFGVDLGEAGRDYDFF